MNKQQQIEEMARAACEHFDYDMVGQPCTKCRTYDKHCYTIHQAEILYNAGYRKLPEDSVVLSMEEYERLLKTAQGKIGNMKSTDFLKACISSGVMVEAVSTEEQVKQAVKDFAERLRKRIADTMYSREGYVDYDDTMEVIDETLKEYVK